LDENRNRFIYYQNVVIIQDIYEDYAGLFTLLPHNGGIRKGGIRINNLRYADDTTSGC